MSVVSECIKKEKNGMDYCYILMRKAVAWELGGSVVVGVWPEDLNRALRMVWGSTSGVGWEEAGRPPGRLREAGSPSFLPPPPAPGVSLSLLMEQRWELKTESGCKLHYTILCL